MAPSWSAVMLANLWIDPVSWVWFELSTEPEIGTHC
jgi:hypothetical protein